MCHKMFDESQKQSGCTKESCKSECVDHVFIVGFIKKYINILKIILQRISFKIQFQIPD